MTDANIDATRDVTETPEAMEARIRATIESERALAAAGYEYERDATPAEVALVGARPIQGTAVRVFRQSADRPNASTVERQWRESEPRHRIFTVERHDGTTVDYTMPAAANPTVLLRFMGRTRTEGDGALVDLFNDTLAPSDPEAPDAYTALLDETAGEPSEVVMGALRAVAKAITTRLQGEG